MKVRDSSMPTSNSWNDFFDAENIISILFNNTIISGDITEFGSGYGTFSIPSSKMTRSKLYALDIEAELINEVIQKAKIEHIFNIEAKVCDFVKDGTNLECESQEHVMIYNLLHLENPINLLNEAKRILKKDGTISIMHWKSDIKTPRGPSLNIRPTPIYIKQLLKKVGFTSIEDIKLGSFAPYHYAIIAKK
jgi:ubiquinone/menaquinone biosynthesis C-methylase UbiE